VARREGRIAELPAPRARKALPLRRATWYVHVHAGHVLLERRPESGLWGGLWTFPERRLRGAARSGPLPPLEHGFTHFRLRARPVLCAVRAPTHDTPGRRWVNLADALGAAVPTPVRRVLRALLPGGPDQAAQDLDAVRGVVHLQQPLPRLERERQ
jgi:A/G-specific adenine glycosylase